MPKRAPGEVSISSLTVVRLNDPDNVESLTKPWPPPSGLDPGQDPFVTIKPEPEDLRFSALESSGEEKSSLGWVLDRERAAALSVIAHLVLLLLFFVMPPAKQRPADEKVPDPLGLVELFKPPEIPERIPVQFFPSPGPAAKAPGMNPLPSDANRRASGGDPSLPKDMTPKAVPEPGIRDLAPGKEGQREAAAQSRGAAEGEGQSREGQETQAKNSNSAEKPTQIASAEPLQKRLSGLPSSVLSGLTAEGVSKSMASGQSGEGGGGWEREGGFVDNGPLAFDTQDYDWGPYAAEMLRRIKRHWEVPTLAYYGVKGRVVIRFYIRRDGQIEDIRIISSSGIPPYDNAAYQAIKNSNPLRGLPPDLGTDREGVTISFFYNIRPEDYAAR